QLLLEATLGFAQRHARVALAQPTAAELGKASLCGPVLDAGIAVAEIAGEVEGQLLGERAALRDRLRMIARARRHRRRVSEHVGIDGTAQRLAGLQREM